MDFPVEGIAWDNSYRLGNRTVDEQHKQLFELLGGIAKACRDGTDKEQLQSTLDFLVKYAVSHFEYEEKLQAETHYPDYIRHAKLHDDFKKTVGELVEKYRQGGSNDALIQDTNRIIVRWLVNHILREDLKIGAHLRLTKGTRPLE